MSAKSSQNEDICKLLDVLSSIYSRAHRLEDCLCACNALARISLNLAHDPNSRNSISLSYPPVWPKIHAFWELLSPSATDDSSSNLEVHYEMVLAIARLTRNLVAGSTGNQTQAYEDEPHIRILLHRYTSYLSIEEPRSYIVTRFLMQALSNIITANENLIERLWNRYMDYSENQNIILRSLAHPDDSVVIATLVLISNCLFHNPERMNILLTTASGQRICVCLLDKLSQQSDAYDDGDNAEIFHIGWSIFKTLFDHGFAPTLFSIVAMDDEIITPQQTTLLKVLDSYLLQYWKQNDRDIVLQVQEYVSSLTAILTSRFFELSQYAQISLRRSLGIVSTATHHDGCSAEHGTEGSGSDSHLEPMQEFDTLLPKVCEAIVLTAQCFCTLSLRDETLALSQQSQRTKTFLIEAASPQSQGLLENVIDASQIYIFGVLVLVLLKVFRIHELLRLLDDFLPRIMFGKASWSTSRPDVPDPSTSESHIDVTGFNYLKRDLVRLIGTLAYENRGVQDRIRECDGITVIMNLCITDERNPYLREHALFALRNILHENVENQAIVDAIKPMGSWDENGVLQDSPGTRR